MNTHTFVHGSEQNLQEHPCGQPSEGKCRGTVLSLQWFYSLFSSHKGENILMTKMSLGFATSTKMFPLSSRALGESLQDILLFNFLQASQGNKGF